MKQEFIKKWKSWWMLQEQGAELTDAFERELNELMLNRDIKCKCSEEEKHGETSILVCNNCGNETTWR